jgi:4-diphosphocytidyl-2-C-methyl-D-erythritol kinase
MLTLLAPAKINLYLEIIGNRPDGFHELVMVMQSVALADTITLRSLSTPHIRILCNHPLVPKDHSNLAHQAVTLLQKRCPKRTSRHGGVEITIDKRIPVGAGLAGGSSNAAATLFGLDILWNLGLTRMELQTLGAELGSDVPFSLAGGCAIATGRGEEINPLPHTPQLCAVLAKYNRLSVSTPWAYQTYRQQFSHSYLPLSDTASLEERQARVHSSGMVKALSNHRQGEIGQYLYNDLEKVVLPAHAEVKSLKETMAKVVAEQSGLGTLMSGSGPTVFALCETPEQGQRILDGVRSQIPDPDLQLFVAPFTHQGIQQVSASVA